MTWSGMRHKLEQAYLAESLRGRIQYFATSYRESHDADKGRAAIRVDGEEIFSGNTFFRWYQMGKANEDWGGAFDQRGFYEAFEAFDNQSIEQSLSSDNLLVRIFALLDRRVGKRRLIAMREDMKSAPEALKRFYDIRVRAEGLAQ